MIYLDNAATTKMFEEGADLYKQYACHSFFNPSAGYSEAIAVKKELDNVRNSILNKLGLDKGNVIFTSGATESNNLAILGSKRNGKCEYVFSVGEHPSVYNVARELERLGNIVHYIKLTKDGTIDYESLYSCINENTRLISIEHVNNETGAINDIARVSKIRNTNASKALLHVDGVQAFCKLDTSNIGELVDFYTISAHKFHGPKGVGALYVKNINSLKSIVFGGGQEDGYRSGTENVGGILAMGYAIEQIDIENAFNFVELLKNKMIEVLSTDVNIHIDKINGSPYILSAWFAGVNGETLMRALADKGVIVSTGSACSSKKAGNRVLENMNFNRDEIKSHVRISFNSQLSLEEVEWAGKIIIEEFNNIRKRVI